MEFKSIDKVLFFANRTDVPIIQRGSVMMHQTFRYDREEQK